MRIANIGSLAGVPTDHLGLIHDRLPGRGANLRTAELDYGQVTTFFEIEKSSFIEGCFFIE